MLPSKRTSADVYTYPIIAVGAALLIFGACSAPEKPVNTPDRHSEEALEMRRETTQRKNFERPDPDTSPAVTGEVPADLLEAIYRDLERRTGASSDEFELLRAEAVLWNDGALGCPEPGVFYVQVLINGYRVVLRHREAEYDYRADDRGAFRLCTGGPLGSSEQ